MGDWDADEGILYFEPQPNVDSYFYENTGCLATGADGYDALTFRLKGARSGSYHVEVQAQDSCDATAP